MTCCRRPARSSRWKAAHFDVVELLDTVERERVKSITIVGDAFAKPMLRALDAEPDRWDVSGLRVHRVVGRHVERGDQGRPAPPQPPAADARLARLVGGHRDGARHARRADGAAGTARSGSTPRHPGPHRRWPRRRARLRRAGPGGPAGPHAARLLQGPGEVGGHLPRHRRRALLDPRRLGRGRRRRHGQAARPGQPVHQHRRREGVSPRRSRRCSSGTRPSPTPPSSACPTSASARRSPPSSSPHAGQPIDAGRRHRPREGPPGRLQGAQAGRRGGDVGQGRQRQARLPGARCARRARQRPTSPFVLRGSAYAAEPWTRM